MNQETGLNSEYDGYEGYGASDGSITLDPWAWDTFEDTFNNIATACHQMAISKGFWDEDRNDGEMIALMHSELSETLEALRRGNPPSEHIPGFSSAEEELADLIIRVMDTAVARNYRLAQAIESKFLFNASREKRHGKKF